MGFMFILSAAQPPANHGSRYLVIVDAGDNVQWQSRSVKKMSFLAALLLKHLLSARYRKNSVSQ